MKQSESTIHTQNTILPPECIEADVSLKERNWFNTGGNARFFAEPSSIQMLRDVVGYAKQQQLPIHILGSGANVLISDEGFDGLIISPAFKECTVLPGAHVRAGSGVSVAALIDFCLESGLLGLEEFSGIPGAVGGSVYINLHYFQFLFSHFLVSAHVLDMNTLEVIEVDNAWFNFGYNSSKLNEKQHLLIDATFALKPANALAVAHARGRQQEIIRHRQQRYPRSHTCGSFFRNFHENEVTFVSNGKKMIYVAYYLDKLGIKGQLSSGDAIVSYQHANMIVNKGNATTADIINLACTMQEMVRGAFKIVPQPECQLIGFIKYPFIK